MERIRQDVKLLNNKYESALSMLNNADANDFAAIDAAIYEMRAAELMAQSYFRRLRREAV